MLERLSGDGVSATEIAEVVARLLIEPVFTAHPTEAVRRAMLEKEHELVRRLIAGLDPDHAPVEQSIDLERMRVALTTSWQTADTALEKPSVADEREHVGFYLTDVLYRIVPMFYEVFGEALQKTGVEIVLAKSDMAIFQRYSRLAEADAHEQCHAVISAEFERVRDTVLAIKDENELLAHELRLRQPIRLRNPYVDPISLLQVDLLARWRAADRKDDALLQALIATVNGIAAGIQKTG